MSLNEILASGGALLLFLTLVQITPIKSVVCGWKNYRKRHKSHRKVDEQGCYG